MMWKWKKREKGALRERIIAQLDIPLETVTEVPVINLLGNKEISVENFEGLLEYTEQRMRLNTTCGVVVVDGIKLEAKSMTEHIIVIKGTILQVSFVQ